MHPYPLVLLKRHLMMDFATQAWYQCFLCLGWSYNISVINKDFIDVNQFGVRHTDRHNTHAMDKSNFLKPSTFFRKPVYTLKSIQELLL